MVRIKANTRRLIARIDEIAERVSDFRPVWDRIINRVIIAHINEIFDTAGQGSWPPRKDNLPHPLLQLTGALRSSFTQPDAEGNVNEQTPTGLTYGSDIFYAQFHEEGTDVIPPRRITGLLLENVTFEQSVINEIENYFQEVIDGGI